MSRFDHRSFDRLDPRKRGREEPHWIRTAVSTITMAAAVGAAGLAVWRYLQENPGMFGRDESNDQDRDDFDGPTAPDVPPPYGEA